MHPVTTAPGNVMHMAPRQEPPRADPEHVDVTVIVPESGWASLELGEVWRYRDLLLLLAWRDIAARYRQSVIGYGWAILKPVLSMIIFTFIFGRVAKIPSDSSPYPLFAFTAMLPWLYFANTLSASTTSVVTSSHMLTKVYFPRMVLPISSVVIGLVELAIQFVVLAGLIAYFNGTPVESTKTPASAAAPVADSTTPDERLEQATPRSAAAAADDAPRQTAGTPVAASEKPNARDDEQPAVWRFSLSARTLCLPLFLVLCVLTAMAVGLWLTALNVMYRDIGQAVPFLVQAWFYLSPVVYSSSLVPEKWRPYYGLNPMVGVIEGFRWSILGSTTPDWTMMAVSTAVVSVLLVSGLYYFRRTESTFADII
ncbi:MAG: ABC transporter permease [Planctomycetaceae bacterium]|nr:ABC transporter permease [Planctomycetaceae bacterium]